LLRKAENEITVWIGRPLRVGSSDKLCRMRALEYIFLQKHSQEKTDSKPYKDFADGERARKCAGSVTCDESATSKDECRCAHES